MRIELVYFAGCPHVADARSAIAELVGSRAGIVVLEIDTAAPGTPTALVGWPSPTVLVDGRDLMGIARGAGPACAAYDSAELRARLREALDSTAPIIVRAT
jgi:hypothetical protein